MVEVHLVGCTVPRVVRAAVNVEEQRLWRRRVRVAHDPAVHDRAVRDRERPLDTRIELDLGKARSVLGKHRLGSGREIEVMSSP